MRIREKYGKFFLEITFMSKLSRVLYEYRRGNLENMWNFLSKIEALRSTKNAKIECITNILMH